MPPRIRFGAFDLDTRSGELRHQGFKVKLQEQPFQVLALLAQRPGELVTREELAKRLWPGNTFVDFERGLNKAINRLRKALRDDANEPCFIETLPQRGYRFIAQIETADADSIAASQIQDQPVPQWTPRIDSLAVLPLDNLSGDPAQEYFSDGLTEELICELARLGSLRVISRTSVMQYKGTLKSLPAIAKELSVDAVVEGSVARSNQRVRIIAQLIHAPDDKHLWSGRYERDLRDILQLQAELARSIAVQIQKVVEPELARPDRARQVDPEAYEAYLKGNFYWNKHGPADLEKGIGFFRQAIALDPNFAPAYGAISWSYFVLGVFGMEYPVEVFAKARANAVKALELDRSVPAAHNALAAVNIFYNWDWAGAEAESRRAAELHPGHSVSHAWLADYMSIRGRHDEAIAEFRRALQLDPISPFYSSWLGLILYRARRFAESITQCRRALEIDPTHVNALWFMALSLEQTGELPEAIANLEKAVSLSEGPHFRALLGRACALAGDETRALRILSELKDLSKRRYVSPFDMAMINAGLDERDATFQFLEEAYQQRVWRIIELTLPMFDNLRSDSRWQDLVRRIGLGEGPTTQS